VEKELAKTEKQSTGSQNIKIAGLDVFLSHDIFSFADKDEMGSRIKITDSN